MNPVAHLYTPTSMLVTFRGRVAMRLCTVAQEALDWDAPKPETTHALHDDYRGIYLYVQLTITGRKVRTHECGTVGTKAQLRFTGTDDEGETIDAIVIQAV